MFPTKLDGACVLYYTPKGDYGSIKYPNGEIAGDYRYLAICKYENDDAYYLFCCNEDFEVINDSLHSSIDACMAVVASSYKENIVWNKAG